MRSQRFLRAMLSSRLARDESGGVLVLTAVFIVVLLGFAALVVDVGDWFGTKRQAQTAADAGALAAAQDLCNEDADTAIATGEAYVAENLPSATPTVVTPYDGDPGRVEVTVDTTADSFFAAMFGIESADIKTRAVAASKCTAVERPLAVFVHELCGAPTGNKGLIVNGQNGLVEGGIHVNGHLTVNGTNFESVGEMSVYRPPPQGTSPNRADRQHSEKCKTENSDSVYCTGCEGGPTSTPEHGPYRDWVTPYHTEAIMKSFTPCTINHTGDVKYNKDNPVPDGVHCLPADKKFSISDEQEANITVIGGFLEVTSPNSTLRPYNDAHPVLFYSTNTAGKEIYANPGQNFDWAGYIINRQGGIVVNAEGVTSPFKGLLEAEWVQINGNDFRMLGTFPDETGGFNSEVTLDE